MWISHEALPYYRHILGAAAASLLVSNSLLAADATPTSTPPPAPTPLPPAAVALQQQTPPTVNRLTWDECIRLAVYNNPDLQAAKSAITNADAVHSAAYADFFPQITVSAGAQRDFTQRESGRSLNVFGASSSSSNYSTQFDAQVSAVQTIFDGFKTVGNVDQTKAQVILALATMGLQKAVVSFELKSAFAQLIYSQELIRITQGVVELRETNVRLVNLLYNGGRENKGALLLSQANLSAARFDYAQAQRNRDVSEQQLVSVIGRPIPVPIEAIGELRTTVVPLMPNFTQLAVKTPAFLQQDARTKAAAAGVTIARSDFFPLISANASAFRQGDQFPPKQNGWSVGGTLTYPIFEGGRTYFNVKAAKATLQQSIATLQSTANDAAVTLAQNFKSFIDAVSQVSVVQERLDATTLRFQIAQAQYRNGLISFQDFDLITTDYVNQQKNILSTKRDAVIAESNWEQAQGLGVIP